MAVGVREDGGCREHRLVGKDYFLAQVESLLDLGLHHVELGRKLPLHIRFLLLDKVDSLESDAVSLVELGKVTPRNPYLRELSVEEDASLRERTMGPDLEVVFGQEELKVSGLEPSSGVRRQHSLFATEGMASAQDVLHGHGRDLKYPCDLGGRNQRLSRGIHPSVPVAEDLAQPVAFGRPLAVVVELFIFNRMTHSIYY